MVDVKGLDDALIRELVEIIVREAKPTRIILFGSRAKGVCRSDSDVDLLIVKDETLFRGGCRWTETALIRRALWHVPIPIDLLLFTPEEVRKWQDSTNHIIARCLREGKVLYDRP